MSMDPVATSALRPGGRYEVRGTLGSGSFGTVYRMFDRLLGRDVALKILMQTDGGALYRFKREFRSLVGHGHPGLVELHELYSADGVWMYTMELVDGVRFDHWLAPAQAEPTSQRTLDLPRLKGAFAQLADGLYALHAMGKIHRDVKPSNVLVTREGRVVLLDFGLLSDADPVDQTNDGTAIGTVAFMSPEQAAGLPVSPATDWYAFGSMLYEALTGTRPFLGQSLEVLLRKATEVPLPPRALVPDIPEELDRLVARLLDRDADRRPDGDEVLAALGHTPSAATRRLANPRPLATGLREEHGRFLHHLHEAFADAADHPVVVVLLGPAGSGKTSLLEAFLAEIRASSDPIVLGGRVQAGDQTAFPVLDHAIDQLGNAVLRLPPEIRAEMLTDAADLTHLFPSLTRIPALRRPTLPGTEPLPAKEQERRALAALVRIAHRLARSRRLVGWIDDAHAATGRGTKILELEPAEAPPVLLIYLHRSEHHDTHVLRALRALRGDVRWYELPAAPDPAGDQALSRRID